jgi:hypothetical protein
VHDASLQGVTTETSTGDPKRRHLRRRGKSDCRDAEAAARAVLAGHHLGVDETRSSCLQGVAGERQVQLGPKTTTGGASGLSSR